MKCLKYSDMEQIFMVAFMNLKNEALFKAHLGECFSFLKMTKFTFNPNILRTEKSLKRNKIGSIVK